MTLLHIIDNLTTHEVKWTLQRKSHISTILIQLNSLLFHIENICVMLRYRFLLLLHNSYLRDNICVRDINKMDTLHQCLYNDCSRLTHYDL